MPTRFFLTTVVVVVSEDPLALLLVLMFFAFLKLFESGVPQGFPIRYGQFKKILNCSFKTTGIKIIFIKGRHNANRGELWTIDHGLGVKSSQSKYRPQNKGLAIVYLIINYDRIMKNFK